MSIYTLQDQDDILVKLDAELAQGVRFVPYSVDYL